MLELLNNQMLGWIVAGLFAMLCVLVFTVRYTRQEQYIEQEENYLDNLEAQIREAEKHLSMLQQKQIDFRPSTVNNLPIMYERVLDAYENQGIRIPIEIIEELVHSRANTEDEVFKFIESQRNVWKQESMKKVYK